MSFESSPGPGAPIRPIILPPSGAELHNNAEQEPQIVANIAGGKLGVTTRPEFEKLDTEQQDRVQGHRDKSRPSYNRSIITEDGGAYIASCAHGGTYPGQPEAAHEDSQVTEIIATTLQGSLTSENLDGASTDTARWMATEALVSANQAVDQINSDRGISGQASAGVVKTFRDDQGRNFALLVGLGDVRILSVKPDGSYTTQIDAQTDSSNNASGTIDVSHDFDRRFNNSGEQDVNERIQIVPIKPGDRFVMVETGLRDNQGRPISSDDIASAACEQPDPHDAMVDVMRQGIHPEDDINPAELRDIEIVVMDIEQQQVPGLRRIKEAVLKPIIGAHALGRSLAAAFRDRNNQRIAQARTEYQTNPNRNNRLKYIALSAAGLACTAAGAVIIARLYGAAHAIENTWVNTPDAPGPNHTPSHGASPSVSESVSPTPDNQPTNPGADVDTPAAPGAHPKIDYKLPDSTNTLPDIEHLPKGLTVNGDSAKWLNEHTGAGAIGDYNESATTNDGTGTPGTVWHTALKGLKDLGYDVSQMTRDEKGAYVNYVLETNGMSWDDASNLGSDHHIDTPSNYDAILKVTEITGADGSPLEPKEGSVADQHIQTLREDLQRQIDAANNQNVDSGDKGSDNGAGSAKPTETAKPSPSATASPSQQQPTDQVAVQPRATATTSQSPQITSAYSLENPAMIGYAIAGGTLTAAGVGYGMYSAVSAVRRRRAANGERVIATMPPAPDQYEQAARQAQIAAAAQQAAQAAVRQDGGPTPIRPATPERPAASGDDDEEQPQPQASRRPASGRATVAERRAAAAAAARGRNGSRLRWPLGR